MKNRKYFDRELSWLYFNHRVLQEAKDPSVPLYERIKFAAIYSSNLDEFFRVRVASIRSLLSLKHKSQKDLSFDPNKLLTQIRETVHVQQEELGKIFREELVPQLENENIFFVDEKNINDDQREFVRSYFYDQVIPYIQPTLLDKKRIATFLRNKAIYLVIRLSVKKIKSVKEKNISRFKYALVEIPSDRLGRFINLPSIEKKNYIIFLDDLIRIQLQELFPDYKVECSYSIKLTRDAELYIDDEFSGDLLLKIRRGLSKRKTGVPSRFLYDKEMPDEFIKFLRDALHLQKNDIIQGGKYHNINDFFSLPKFGNPKLEYEPMPPLYCKELESASSIFSTISKKDVLLSFPYQSYKYVIKLLEESATDEQVKSIKITLYRVADQSLIIRWLVRAAENGKKVTAFIEVKARFDEELNFASADALEKAGVKVFFSFPGLKVHSKLCLIERIENNISKYYTYLATGNFNEKTAHIYSDFGLLTAHQEIGKEVMRVFNFLERKSKKCKFNHLLASPFNLRKSFIQLIENEIKNAVEGKKAEIIIKLNSLEDRKMIKKLYEASASGVRIKIIVRGICCLIPGIKGLSENIEAFSIVDRFLEHSRVYIFHNDGDIKYFMGSADWMQRNLSRRVEVCFPVYDKDIQLSLQKMIDLQLNDNVKARIIDERQINNYRAGFNEKKIRSQYDIYSNMSKSN